MELIIQAHGQPGWRWSEGVRERERQIKPQTRFYSAIKAFEEDHSNPQRKGPLATGFIGFASQSN